MHLKMSWIGVNIQVFGPGDSTCYFKGSGCAAGLNHSFLQNTSVWPRNQATTR